MLFIQTTTLYCLKTNLDVYRYSAISFFKIKVIEKFTFKVKFDDLDRQSYRLFF
jgi:hypothetical protein